MISQSIVVASAKGGAGKTSVTANLAALVAASHWRVLAVDLDGQANLSMDLGAAGHPDADDGKGLLVAALSDTEPQVVEITPTLSVVPAGSATFQLATTLTADPDPLALLGVSHALERIADEYDLVVIDTPPTGANRIVEAGMAAGHYLLIPTPPDPGSLAGLHLTSSAFASVRATLNPDLTLLGVCLFRIPIAATAIREQARAALEASLGSRVPVYTAIIRDALRAAVDQRRYALSAEAYSSAAAEATPWWTRFRRPADEPPPDPGPGPTSFSKAAAGLAEDYRTLVQEIMGDFVAAQSREVVT